MLADAFRIEGQGRLPAVDVPRSLVVVVFNGALLGSMSFAFGVFEIAAHYGVLPGSDLRIVAGEPDAALVGGGMRNFRRSSTSFSMAALFLAVLAM
ncbi:hypothetical protein K8Z49_25225 [Actinomadura madurae]|uniref:hypothetical protein n=1 Tax=Actinomadura madurae TaxID=1993 RepID=UPI00399AD554